MYEIELSYYIYEMFYKVNVILPEWVYHDISKTKYKNKMMN